MEGFVEGMMSSYYDILGVGKESSATDIKTAFRQLAIRTHPDKQHQNKVQNNTHNSSEFSQQSSSNQVTNDSENFQRIHYAYKVLSDPEMRIKYDLILDSLHSGIIYEVISYSEVFQSNTRNESQIQCKCGDFYEIPKLSEDEIHNLNELDSILECETCSLSIRIIP